MFLGKGNTYNTKKFAKMGKDGSQRRLCHMKIAESEDYAEKDTARAEG